MSNISELLYKTASKSTVNHQLSVVITHHGKVVSVGYNHNLVNSSNNKQCLL
jgi:deoxycytidylate deaminase